MSTARRAIAMHRSPLHPHHGHSKAQCIKVLRRLSAYLDDELTVGICKEIRKHLGACPNCEEFIASLRQAVRLCGHVDPAPLSPAFKARLRIQILKAAGRV
ncbi:MAG: anti-sigma factor family protein [Nitrospiraceae bacterium]